MTILLILLGALALLDPEPLRPAAVLGPDGGPRVVHLETPGSPAVSLRLTVPFVEGPSETGAGLLVRELARGRVESALRPLGARSLVERTSRGLVVTVTGSPAHLDELVAALRVAVDPPTTARLGLMRAKAAARTSAERIFETPGGALLAGLRDRVLPDLPPMVGRPDAVDSLDADALEAFWARTHQPEHMSVVAAGALDPAELARALRGIGAPPDRRAPPPEEGRRLSSPPPEVLRHWYAQAWPAGSPEDPRATVLAALVSRRVEQVRGRGTELGVEVWEIGGQNLLVVAGGAYPPGAAALRRRVAGFLPELEGALDEEEVLDAVERVRRDLLIRARSVEGMVVVVGRTLDSTDDPEAAWRFLENLRRVDTEALEDFLTEILSLSPLRHEIRP